MASRVLIIAFHFPPAMGYSGTQRALKFARYLPEHNWQPAVLTVHPRAYERSGGDQLSELPDEMPIVRAFGLDAMRHLSLKGRYFRFTAMPDRWTSWWWGAVPAGLKLIKQFKPDLIWATYPIATSHRIAHTLSGLTGLPWVADFRDGQWTETFPSDPVLRKEFVGLEAKHVASASRVVVTTDGIRQMYQQRYPSLEPQRFEVIANGYDEENFSQLQTQVVPPKERPLHLVHSGIVYPGEEERDPITLMQVLATLRDAGEIGPESLKITFRGCGMEAYVREQIAQYQLQSMVSVAPTMPYAEALQEMASVDGLLLLQGAHFSHLIPAKLFEYLRMGKPLLALADPAGNAACLMRAAGLSSITPQHDLDQIASVLKQFMADLRKGSWPKPDPTVVRRYERSSLTGDLAKLLEQVKAEG
uniref:Putative GT4: UDP-Glycosyltransferase/glycogen phosphorylase n=1 Tax=Magnetococcus massalia (strain MO-1) TaxID=451514 RepID=A0A1S7LMC1_MAGMO|nr:putative GT4 : UDP-Glycosyltransferase/glycogen phosphorylase [Candidatus Magnetococcus massalia]